MVVHSVVSWSSNLLDCSSACPKFWASAASFIQCIFAMHFWIACLGLCILGQCVLLPRPLIEQLHSGMACMACHWLIYDWCLSKVSTASLAVIGYCCNHLDGQLNWQAFTHCIISRATKLLTVQLVICSTGQNNVKLLCL